MSKKEIKKGTVVKRHPHLHDIKLEDGTEVKAYRSGKMKHNKIQVLEGDKVKVEMPEHGDKGRIIYRLDQ